MVSKIRLHPTDRRLFRPYRFRWQKLRYLRSLYRGCHYHHRKPLLFLRPGIRWHNWI